MKTVINIKTDKEVKNGAHRVAEELGLSLSAVINAYLKQFVRNREVYFSASPRMSMELEKLLGEAEEDIRKKRNLSTPFSSSGEMDRYLDAL